MSDPFDLSFGNWLPKSAGRTSGFFEGLSSGYEQQYQVDAFYAVEDAVYDRWQESLTKLENRTGQKFDMPLDYSSINNYIRAVQGENPSIYQQPITLQGFDMEGAIKQRDPFIKANEAIKQLGDPNITSMEDIVSAVIQRRAEIEQQTAQVNETGGFAAGLGQFFGAIGGTFSERDPLLVGTLLIGGFGRTAAMRIATEMGVIGSIETVQQLAGVEPTRELLGEEPGSPFMNVMYAMAGAGVLRGGFEGAARYIRGINEGRAADELVKEQAANDSWTRAQFEAQPQSPSARAGISLLDEQSQFDAANPYGATETGTRIFVAEIEEIQRIMSGSTETAIGRFLPESPINLQDFDLNVELIKAERPIVHAQLTSAQNRLAEVDEQIAGVQLEISSQSVSDAIARVDPDSGNIARSLEQDLTNPQLLAAQRNAIVQKLDQIVESLGGAERIAEEANNAAIKPKKTLQSLRQSRKAAVKEFKKARDQFDRALVEIDTERKLKETLFAKTVKTENVSTGDPGFNPARLRPDVLAETQKQVDEGFEKLDETAETISKGFEAEDELIDLGNGIMVSRTFKIADFDNPGAEVSIGEVITRIKEDEALVEAMKVCAI